MKVPEPTYLLGITQWGRSDKAKYIEVEIAAFENGTRRRQCHQRFSLQHVLRGRNNGISSIDR